MSKQCDSTLGSGAMGKRWLPQATRRQRQETLRRLAVVLRHAPDAPAVEACRRRLAGDG